MRTGDRRVRRRHRRGQPQPHRQQQPQDPPPRAVPGEYLLHVQETLVAHKERLRRCAEEAARVHRRQVPSRTSASAKESNASCEPRGRPQDVRGLEQIRSGKPLEEILTGAIVCGADGRSIAPGPGHSVRMSTQTMDTSWRTPPRSRARRNLRATAATMEEEEENGRIRRPAAKAAARAMGEWSSRRTSSARAAVEAANAARAEKGGARGRRRWRC